MRKAKREKTKIDRDGNLKEVLSELLLYAIQFYFPDLYAQLDPNRPPILMNKELQAIKKSKHIDKIDCDALVRCFIIDQFGEPAEKIVVLHWEFEGNPREHFGLRVFQYYVRIFDAVKTPEIAIQVIYTGPPTAFQVNKFNKETYGTKVSLEFGACIVCDMNPEILEKHENPFALVLLAVYYTVFTTGEDKAVQRLKFKEKLFELGFARNFSEDVLIALYKFVTNYMDLPVILEQKFELSIEEKYFKEMTRPATQAEMGMASAIYKGIYGINPQIELAKLKEEASSAKKDANAAKKDANAAKKDANAAKKDANAAKKDANAAKKDANAAKKKNEELESYLIKAIWSFHEIGFNDLQIAEKLEIDQDFVKTILSEKKS